MNFEWMKDIIGENYTDEMDEAISRELGKRFVARNDFNSKLEEIKTLNTQISERDNQLKTLKESAGDNEELKAKITRLEEANETAKQDYEKKIAETKFSSALELGLIRSGAKSPKALKGFLDMEKIKLEGDTLTGLDEQIEEIKKDNDYLFGEGASSTGMAQGSGQMYPDGVEARFYERNPDLKTD